MNLKDIKDPSFIKNLSYKELEQLAVEIRAFLLDTIPKTGGHLSSNLGTVELIIALHYVFNSPKDAFIFDVGHQAYTHKILTGRAGDFDQLRQTKGMSGYIDYSESEHDQWESGHAGTAISALMGFLYANDLKQEDGKGIAIVGDASIVNGMSFEALNILGADKKHQGMIILNDNEMSISKSVGAFSRALTKIRSMKLIISLKRFWGRITPHIILRAFGRIKRALRTLLQRQNIFEDLGYMYVGPIDGHDIKLLIKTLNRIKNIKKSVILHIITDKGKGHPEAESDKIGSFHGISQPTETKNQGISWSELIALSMDKLQDLEKTFVIMPAMTVGTKMSAFQKKYPDRYLDIGIAEEHGATMAASLAHHGIKVYYPVYSTFSQRAFDQILNDIARSDHHVVFGIDRAGIVGEDGSTHQGLFDVSMFSLMPNVVITMPYDKNDVEELMYYAFIEQSHPCVIRYPRGQVNFDKIKDTLELRPLKSYWTYLKKGNGPLLISYGPSLDLLIEADRKMNLDATIINARFIKPLDEKVLSEALATTDKVFVYEESANQGGLYPSILSYMMKHHLNHEVKMLSLSDQVVTYGKYEDMLKAYHMDLDAILEVLGTFL
ncbi:MAG: 1-deoxy-D-xylulose-5-phosphate synthase [Acholeplasmataceae bacterium]